MAQRICEKPDCGKPHIALGLCEGHYRRHLKANGRTVPPPPPFDERFEASFTKADGCWAWTALRDGRGYGLISRDGRHALAHRVAYERANGPIPDGLVVRHKCDNPPCVNPDHLEIGTRADNNRDREERGRGFWSNQTHCIHGHPLSGENLLIDSAGHRKCRECSLRIGRDKRARERKEVPPLKRPLTREEQAEILALVAAGRTQRQIGEQLGLRRSTVSMVVHRWRDRASA